MTAVAVPAMSRKIDKPFPIDIGTNNPHTKNMNALTILVAITLFEK